jgi:tetratricopeptide (TPR) repeat protein
MEETDKKTLGLYVICKGTKEERQSITQLLGRASQYVDAIFLTCTRKEALKGVKELAKEYGNVEVSFFKWTNRFDEARNFNFAQGDTDYKMWIDVGDVFPFSNVEKIKEALEIVDCVWLPYHYAWDENGRLIATHWRERVIKKELPFKWRGWVHENLLNDEPFSSKRLDIPVIHKDYDKDASMTRNHEILLEAYKETRDPRYIHYLGLSYYSQEKWQDALDILKEYVTVGGWDEEIYRSLLRMSECCTQLDQDEDATQYALRAAGLMPHYPWAYYNLAELDFQKDAWQECLEWLKVAFSKPEPESAAIFDPTIPEKAKIMAATCEFMLGNAITAEKVLEQVQGEDVSELMPIYKSIADQERLAEVLPFVGKYYDDKALLWEKLPKTMKYDNRFRKIREAFTEPKEWPKKSIVFFCGKAYEEWGPHTLDKGMGGSEEAVIYLSRELAELGYDVHIYGDVKQPFSDQWGREGDEHSNEPMTPNGGMVTYWPWYYMDRRDHFDTLVIWRQPQLATKFKANKILVDMHDLLPKNIVKDKPNVTYLFKTNWHAKQYGAKNYNVIGNGIKENYEEATT